MSLRTSFVHGATAILLAFALPAAGQAPGLESTAPPARFADPARVDKLSRAFPAIDAIMRDFAASNDVPGMAFGVVIDGRLALSGAYGYRDVVARAPVDENTVFRIASMTKSFTAAAILQLRDQGLLSIEDPVEVHVPELEGLLYPTSDSPRLTIRHLLTHSAGFPEDNPWGDQQLDATDALMSEWMREGIPFSTAPGTAYEYSNYGFSILGRIIANVSGMPYPRYVRERLLEPLGMTVTTLEASAVPADRLAHGYRLQDGEWLDEPPLPDGSFGPMGGMLTSAGDLGRWVGFMLDAFPPRDGGEEGPLRRASRREMQQVSRYAGSTAIVNGEGEVEMVAGGYGYALRVQQTCEYPSMVWHTGGLPGYGSIMRWYPDYGVGVFAMGNRTYTRFTTVADETVRLLAETGGLEPRLPQPSPVLLTRQEQVTRLIQRWDDPLADDLAAMNLFRDEPRDRRRAAIERLVAEAGGECGEMGAIDAENALRGRWRMRCRDGDLRVSITLSPTVPARVQALDVVPIRRDEPLRSGQVCRV
jgi:CubicO group peptidase (beta-lactamase class C family)